MLTRRVQVIQFLYSLSLLSTILPSVSSDYPFTSRPFNRNYRRDTEDSELTTSTTRKQLDVARRVKPAYQGYLAFMLICEPDIKCIPTETKLDIIRCLENGMSLAAIYLYKQCTGQGTIICEDSMMTNTVKNCLKAQSGSFANLITDTSRQCIREKVTLGNIDCYKINAQLRSSGQRFSLNPLAVASSSPLLPSDTMSNGGHFPLATGNRPISIFDHLTSTSTTAAPTTTPSPSTTTTTTTIAPSTPSASIPIDPSTVVFMSYITPSPVNNQPFRPNDHYINRYIDLNHPMSNSDHRFQESNVNSPYAGPGAFNQYPTMNKNYAAPPRPMSSGSNGNGNFYHGNGGNYNGAGGGGISFNNQNTNGVRRTTAIADVIYEEYYVDDDEEAGQGEGGNGNSGSNLPMNAEMNNRNGNFNSGRRGKPSSQNNQSPSSNGQQQQQRNRKPNRRGSTVSANRRNRGLSDGMRKSGGRINRGGGGGGVRDDDYEGDYSSIKLGEVVSR